MSIHLSTAMLAHLFSYDMYVFALTSRSVFLLKWEFFFLGRGVQPEKKSNVPRFGLKVGYYFLACMLLTSDRPFFFLFSV